MRFRFLGYGGAFTPLYHNSSAWVEMKDHPPIFVDCGYSIFPRLLELNLANIANYVLITHLHNDHVGSLSTFIYYKFIVLHAPPLHIIYVDEKQRSDLEGYLRYSIPHLEKYVIFEPVSQFPSIQPLNTFGLHSPNYQTYGFVFQEGAQRFVLSGDLADADFVFKNVDLEVDDVVFHDMEFNTKAKSHAYYKNLEQYQETCQLYGYHHAPDAKPNDCSILSVAEKPEYLF